MKYFLLLFLSLAATAPRAQETAQVRVRVHADVDERGFIGIYSGQMNDDKARLLKFDTEYGSYVTRVIPNSGAARARIMPFDYIIGVNDEKVGRNRDLTDLLDAYEPGDQVNVHFIRKGQHRTAKVTLGYRSSTSYEEIPEENQPFLGISPHDDNDDDEFGVRVEVISNSTAESLALQTGDVILAINDYPMIDWSDISTAIDNMALGRNITLRYERDGQVVNVVGPIKSRRETNRAIEVAKQQEPAFLGIYSEQLTMDKARKMGFDNPYGSLVSKVIPGTAAEEYGLRPFDLIFGVDEYRTGENQQLGHILRKYHAGDEATLHIVREGKLKSLPFRFGERSEQSAIAVSPCEDPFLGVRHSFTTNDLEGVGVTVVSHSTASALGLKDGDIITAINGYPIHDWSDIGIAVDNLEIGEEIHIDYRRGNNSYRARQPIMSKCQTEDGGDDGSWPSEAPDVRDNNRSGNLNINIENLTSSEAAHYRQENNIALPVANDLRVEGLNLGLHPANGKFRLQFNLPNSGETVIKIYNSTGRQIYNYDLGNFSGEFNDEVDISRTGRNNYYITIRQGDRSISKKIEVSGS